MTTTGLLVLHSNSQGNFLLPWLSNKENVFVPTYCSFNSNIGYLQVKKGAYDIIVSYFPEPLLPLSR